MFLLIKKGWPLASPYVTTMLPNHYSTIPILWPNQYQNYQAYIKYLSIAFLIPLRVSWRSEKLASPFYLAPLVDVFSSIQIVCACPHPNPKSFARFICSVFFFIDCKKYLHTFFFLFWLSSERNSFQYITRILNINVQVAACGFDATVPHECLYILNRYVVMFECVGKVAAQTVSMVRIAAFLSYPMYHVHQTSYT